MGNGAVTFTFYKSDNSSIHFNYGGDRYDEGIAFICQTDLDDDKVIQLAVEVERLTKPILENRSRPLYQWAMRKIGAVS